MSNSNENTKSASVTKLPRSETAPRRLIFVRDLVLDAYIGVYDEEQGVSQPVRIDIEVEVAEPGAPEADRLEDVMCYNRLTEGVKAIIASGHIKLVETLAERIASLALSHPMAISARIRVEKPRAIEEANAAGVEIMRVKGQA